MRALQPTRSKGKRHMESPSPPRVAISAILFHTVSGPLALPACLPWSLDSSFAPFFPPFAPSHSPAHWHHVDDPHDASRLPSDARPVRPTRARRPSPSDHRTRCPGARGVARGAARARDAADGSGASCVAPVGYSRFDAGRQADADCMRTVREGVFLRSKGLSPYESGSYHVVCLPPLYLPA